MHDPGWTRRQLLRRGTGAAVAGAAVSSLSPTLLGVGRARASVRARWSVDRSDTYEIAQLTGQASINTTGSRWSVYGTDLGHMVDHGGALYVVFGDTFGANDKDWRSNVLARSDDHDPWNGITFTEMVTDRPGHAKELISQPEVPGEEVTVIPTYGVSLDGRLFLHYMAVRHWGEPGHWTLNRSGLAYSDDDGQTWKLSDAVWPGDSNFGQVAFVEDGQYVYIFGIPGGRFGGVKLARVEKRHLLDLSKYTYWDGATWSNHQGQGRLIVPAPAGELSVRWNSYYETWLMTYLNESRGAVVLRTAGRLTGPWSEESIVVTAGEAPQLYAPYIPPWWNDGPDIFFALSLFGPYNVFWWHTSLTGGGRRRRRDHGPAGGGSGLPGSSLKPRRTEVNGAAPRHNRPD